jgi:acyl-CoA thioesterase-1
MWPSRRAPRARGVPSLAARRAAALAALVILVLVALAAPIATPRAWPAPAPPAVPAEAAPAASSEPVLLAFGDSLTAGLGVPPEDSYPGQLSARLRAAGYRYRVINGGISGDTSAGGLRRVDWALRARPVIVIVALGANDGLRGQDVAAIRANLERIVERFQAAGARVLLAGMRLPVNYGDAYGDAFRGVYPAVARARRVPLMPFLLEGVGGRSALNQPDGIHPTAEGYRKVVDHLWPHLLPMLAK